MCIRDSCNLEYNLGETLAELEDVVITVPLPGSAVHPPQIVDCDGETVFDSKNSQLLWKLTSVDASNSSGALEFAVPQSGHEDFFPVQVSFTSPTTMCAMQVLQVLAADSGAPVRFSKQTTFKVDSYTCLLYTSDAADEEDSVDLGGRRIIKKKKN
eukprot:TRINITY_DN32429_c0_g1_i3.p1 TRINITY_DN32429_c0_g1~~TRINITY_DN32429_c0_g1_i3.p1  ORF type:complete len:156 (-),score=60.65 TRINITY_DN32429_c0_g1_i3:55-522(-)